MWVMGNWIYVLNYLVTEDKRKFNKESIGINHKDKSQVNDSR